MSKTLRITGHVCILLALTIFVGCSDDDPAAPAPIMGGSVGVYADAEGNTLVTEPMGGGQVTVYVMHRVPNGAKASSFRVEAPAGWTYAPQPPAFEFMFPVTIGNPVDGVSVGYGECLTNAVHVLTLSYVTPGNTPPDAMFKILPHTGTPGSIEVVDCDDNLLRDAVGEHTAIVQP